VTGKAQLIILSYRSETEIADKLYKLFVLKTVQ